MSIAANPVALTLNTQFALPLPGGNLTLDQVDWIVLSNNSPYVLQVVCGSTLFHVPAWYHYPFPFVSGVTGGPYGKKDRLFTSGNEVDVTPIQQTIPGSSFTAQLFYTLYLNGETPPQTVPSPLGGGPINLTVASSINQTGQPGGNSVVFAEPVGDSSLIGTVNINNLGQMTLGDLSNRGALTIEGLSTDPNINLSITGLIRITNSSGNLVADLEQGFLKLANSSGTTKITLDALNSAIDLIAGAANALHLGQTASGDTIDTAGGVTYLKSSGNIVLQSPNGTAILTIAPSGQLTFKAGSTLTAIKGGFTAVTTAGTSITHGLGVTPTSVVCVSGSAGVFATFTITGVGATTFTCTPSANCNAFWIAMAN